MILSVRENCAVAGILHVCKQQAWNSAVDVSDGRDDIFSSLSSMTLPAILTACRNPIASMFEN